MVGAAGDGTQRLEAENGKKHVQPQNEMITSRHFGGDFEQNGWTWSSKSGNPPTGGSLTCLQQSKKQNKAKQKTHFEMNKIK